MKVPVRSHGGVDRVRTDRVRTDSGSTSGVLAGIFVSALLAVTLSLVTSPGALLVSPAYAQAELEPISGSDTAIPDDPAAVAPAAGPIFAPQQELAPEVLDLPVGSIHVRGTTRAESLFVAQASGLEVGYPTGRQSVRSAVRSLYALGLFSNIQVVDETPLGASRRTLTIDVDENPRIRTISWSGNDKLGTEDLKAEIDLQAGDLLSSQRLFQAKNAVLSAYADEGYASADVFTEVTPSETGNDVSLEFKVDEGKRVKITDVHFAGATAFEKGKLRGEIELKPNNLFRRKRYTAARLREDEERLQDFYRNHGYMEAEVKEGYAEYSEDRSEVELTFQVQEGPFFRFGDVTWNGNNKVSTDRLNATTPIRPGDAYSREKVDGGAAEGYSHYQEEGYLLGIQIVPEVSVQDSLVNVAYHVEEGEPSRVREIRIVGNTRTREYVIRRELSLVPGDRLRRSTLLRIHRDIFALGYFEDVGVEYAPAGEGNDIDVVFRVQEKSAGTATAGAGYSSDTGLTGFLEFGHNNIFGRGQALNLHLERGGRRETYDVSFTDSWAFGTPTSLGFHVFNTERDLDIYEERRRGFGLNAGRPWPFRPDFTRIYASYALEDVEFRDFQNLNPTSEEFLRESNRDRLPVPRSPWRATAPTAPSTRREEAAPA